jgi:hypothetical protein
MYQYNIQVDLIGNCHNFIFKLRESQLKHSYKCCVVENFLVKKGVFYY